MPHGKICYLEIPANNAEDAAAFYASLLGWKVRQRGDGNLDFDDSGSVSGRWVKASDRTPDELDAGLHHGRQHQRRTPADCAGRGQGPDAASGHRPGHGSFRGIL